jgi:P4 family phage/plasmid primase-like protien
VPIFGEHAQEYVSRGFSPLPIGPGTKRPILSSWQIYCGRPPAEAEIKEWSVKYAGHGIGLALGRQVGDYRLIAIDVDADDLIERVKQALDIKTLVAKKGKKGLTIFCLAPPTLRNEKIKRFLDGKPDARPSVEVLAQGSQTIIPPSIHPDTQKPYEWIGTPLLRANLEDLPIFRREAELDEITAHCHGNGKYFDALNQMVWLGVNNGGNTHDSCLEAVASMVARGWEKPNIRARILRAKKESCERARQIFNWPEAGKVIDEWIDSAQAKGMGEQKKVQRPVVEQIAADAWIERMGGLEGLACVDGDIREYRDGHWPLVPIKQLQCDLANFDARMSDRNVHGAVGLITKKTGQNVSFQPGLRASGYICLLNGTVNVRTGELERHDPGHGLLHQLPIEWDEKAECPTYRRFAGWTLGNDEEAINLWEEFAALTLVDDMSFQKMLFLRGSGANGKSTLVSLLRSMHDPSAVAAESITDLDHEYHRACLIGRLVSIASEQSRLSNISDRFLKAIIGQDPITMRRPYQEPHSLVLTVRFIQVVNEMPMTSDLTDALRRRIMIVDCPNVIAEDQQDRDLLSKLLVERPGILKRWCGALRRLYQRGRFNISRAGQTAVGQYMMENDPVMMWLDERCEPSEDGIGTPTGELYADFSMWEKTANISRFSTSLVRWGTRLTSLGYPGMVKRAGRQVMRFRAVKIRSGMAGPM